MHLTHTENPTTPPVSTHADMKCIVNGCGMALAHDSHALCPSCLAAYRACGSPDLGFWMDAAPGDGRPASPTYWRTWLADQYNAAEAPALEKIDTPERIAG